MFNYYFFQDNIFVHYNLPQKVWRRPDHPECETEYKKSLQIVDGKGNNNANADNIIFFLKSTKLCITFMYTQQEKVNRKNINKQKQIQRNRFQEISRFAFNCYRGIHSYHFRLFYYLFVCLW